MFFSYFFPISGRRPEIPVLAGGQGPKLTPTKEYPMRAEIIANMIYSEGPEYPEYVMHFLPKVFRDPQISEYVRQILSQSVHLSKQKIA